MLRNLLDSTRRSARSIGRLPPPMLLVVLGLVAAGCAPVSTIEGRAQKVRAGEEVIPLEAGSFYFRPNRILASAGARLRFKVKNASSLAHNLTVETPDGKVILSLDVPGGETRQETSGLLDPGEYVLYCNRPGHRAFGMKGALVAR